ncbi:MAG: DUF4389 domain-containing protein [Gammaproteobacteria bacterium]|nr:DUF4389 domain-containing protein [Gammaproteobacteria bacterium]
MKQNLRRRDSWVRLFFIVLFALIYSVAEVVLFAVVVVQFGFVLISGERNQKLLRFGADLSRFVYDILRYVTFNSDDRPFPFSDWPVSGHQGSATT